MIQAWSLGLVDMVLDVLPKLILVQIFKSSALSRFYSAYDFITQSFSKAIISQSHSRTIKTMMKYNWQIKCHLHLCTVSICLWITGFRISTTCTKNTKLIIPVLFLEVGLITNCMVLSICTICPVSATKWRIKKPRKPKIYNTPQLAD